GLHPRSHTREPRASPRWATPVPVAGTVFGVATLAWRVPAIASASTSAAPSPIWCWFATARLPAIGLSGHHRQGTYTHSRDPHWRPRTLHRGGPAKRAGQVAEPSQTIDGPALPERAYHVDGFRDTGHALGPRRIPNAVTLPDLPGRIVLGADAQPQIEPTMREMIDG